MGDKYIISAYAVPGVKVIKESTIVPTKSNMIRYFNSALATLEIIYNISVKDTMSKSRVAEHVYVRHLFIYWANELFGKNITMVDIGRFLHRDHTTIITSIKQFKNRLTTDAPIPYKIGDRNTIKDYNKTKGIIKARINLITNHE